MSDLMKVLVMIKATGGDPKLVLIGFSLAMATLCERLVAHDVDDSSVADALDDIKELYEEAEKYA
jgi:hypothetical protein